LIQCLERKNKNKNKENLKYERHLLLSKSNRNSCYQVNQISVKTGHQQEPESGKPIFAGVTPSLHNRIKSMTFPKREKAHVKFKAAVT
jgi:hypothetical protein